jgi:putative peptide zinc metalloprotease protein
MVLSAAPSDAPAQSAVPLRLRPDLVFRPAQFRGVECWLVKNPLSLQYHRLHPAQYQLLRLCDGARSLDGLCQEFQRRFPMYPLTPGELWPLLVEFHQQGLLWSEHPEQGAVLRKRAEREWWRGWGRAMLNPLFIRLPAWNAGGVLTRLDRWAGWLFSAPAVALGLVAIVLSWLLLAVEAERLALDWSLVQQHLGWTQLAWLWVTVGVAKVLHELGHGLACRRQGGECQSIGGALMLFSPSLYCDVSDAWMLPSRWSRLAIGAAGMYVELLIAAGSLLAWRLTGPGWGHELALHTYLVTTLTTILFNANPLLQYDGYHMLADLVEIPNLRSRAERLLDHWLARHALGCQLPHTDPFVPPQAGAWLTLYAVASLGYRWLMVVGMAWMLRDRLAPVGLARVGWWWGVGTVVLAFLGLAWKLVQLWRQRDPGQSQPLRAMLAGGVVAALLAAAFWLPLPNPIDLPVIAEPADLQPVYVQVSGELGEALVAPGDWVEEGQLLARLESFDLADQYAKLVAARDVQRIELAVQRKLNNVAGVELASEMLSRLELELTALRARQDRLEVRAPCAGRVVAPPERPSVRLAAGTQPARGATAGGDAAGDPGPGGLTVPGRLEGWSGSPLESRNERAWLETGTLLCVIAPRAEFAARAYVEQARCLELPVGQGGWVQWEQSPEQWTAAVLEGVSEQPVAEVPAGLSRRHGGPLATEASAGGSERVPTPLFTARVTLEQVEPGLVTGQRGRVRFAGPRRTAWQWGWRWLCATFRMQA